MGATVTRVIACDGCEAVILPGPELADGDMIGLSVLRYEMGSTEPLWFCGWPCVALYAARQEIA